MDWSQKPRRKGWVPLLLTHGQQAKPYDQQSPRASHGIVWSNRLLYVVDLVSFIQGLRCEMVRSNYSGSRGVQLLEQPFWIGILVVFSFLLLTGIVICIRRKFLKNVNLNCCQMKPKSYSNGKNVCLMLTRYIDLGGLSSFKDVENCFCLQVSAYSVENSIT